jgi:sodium/hydrogen exchanger-like protein 6/7
MDHGTTRHHLKAIEKATQSYLFYVSFMIMMIFMFVTKSLVEKYKPSIGHETCYTIIFGVLFSVILYFSTPNAAQELGTFSFKPNFFFNFFLPPIVFNSGFNMRKKMFFKNLGNIAVSGLFVTIVCFVIYAAGGYMST